MNRAVLIKNSPVSMRLKEYTYWRPIMPTAFYKTLLAPKYFDFQ